MDAFKNCTSTPTTSGSDTTDGGTRSPVLGRHVEPPLPTHAASTAPGVSTSQGGNFVPLEFMKTMMHEMMTTLIQTASNAFPTPLAVQPLPRARNLEHIYLPSFNPDDRTDTVQVWCRHVEELKSEYQLNERETLNLARKNLKGRAADWAKRNYTTLTTWEELKKSIIQTFSDETRYYDDLTAFMEYTSDKASSLADYATRKWELAKKAIGIGVTELHLVEAVISGMSDFRIRSDLLRLTPQTLPQLIQSLNSYKRRRPMSDTDHGYPPKKAKYNPSDFTLQRCQKCFKLGHLDRNCRAALSANSVPTSTTSATAQSHNLKPERKEAPIKESPKALIACSFCQKPGHKFENCFKRLNRT